MLTAIEAPLYDIGVLSERGMLPGLNGMLAAAVPDRLCLLKHPNAHGSHIYIRPSGSIYTKPRLRDQDLDFANWWKCEVGLLVVAHGQVGGDGFEVAKEAACAVVGAGGEIEL
jgi:hypothetical protein